MVPQTQFSAGTFCSGTDAPILVYNAFLEAASKEFFPQSVSATPTVNHMFSAEVEEKKRSFLQDFFDMKFCFTDVLDIPRTGGNMFDCKSESWQKVPTVNWAAAGFPCDDASALHPKQSTAEHRLCVAKVMFCHKSKL